MLDEPSSALDAITEAAIFDNLSRLSPRPTIVLIAHRLTTARDADQVVVLEDGRAVESGTHDELLLRDGAYARLWFMQHRSAQRPPARGFADPIAPVRESASGRASEVVA